MRAPAQDDAAATWTVQSFHGLLNAIDAYIEVETALRAAVEAAREAGYSWDILLTALPEDQRAAMRRFAD